LRRAATPAVLRRTAGVRVDDVVAAAARPPSSGLASRILNVGDGPGMVPDRLAALVGGRGLTF
jgi:hypothetical protein